MTIAWRSVFTASGDHFIQAATRSAHAPAFGEPVNIIDSVDGLDGTQIATGADGTTTITWYTTNAAGVVQAATRPAGAPSFSPPLDVSDASPDHGGASTPGVAVGANGTTTITWVYDYENNGERLAIQAATRVAGAPTFSTPAVLTAAGVAGVRPQVGVEANGTTTITWYTGDWVIQAATRAAGQAVFAPAVDLSTGRADSPQIAVGPDGATTITWECKKDAESTYAIQASTRSAGAATFGVPQVLSSSTDGYPHYSPTLAVGADGATTVAWQKNMGPANSDNTIQAATASYVTGVAPPTTAAAPAVLASASPKGIRWRAGNRTTSQLITASFTAAPEVTYTITATSNATRRLQTRTTRTARGTCKITTNKKTQKRTATCTIRLKKAGTWLVKITPTQHGISGTPATKTFKIRTPRPAGTALPPQPVTG